MSAYEEHGCGGLLKPARVYVERRGIRWTVPGLRCDECGEELMEPETLRSIERAEQEERAREERARHRAS